MTPTLRTAILDALMDQLERQSPHFFSADNPEVRTRYASHLDMILPIAEPMIREAALREARDYVLAKTKGGGL